MSLFRLFRVECDVRRLGCAVLSSPGAETSKEARVIARRAGWKRVKIDLYGRVRHRDVCPVCLPGAPVVIP